MKEPVILHSDGGTVQIGSVQNERFTGNENFVTWLESLLTPETRALLVRWERKRDRDSARHARKRAAVNFLDLGGNHAE